MIIHVYANTDTRAEIARRCKSNANFLLRVETAVPARIFTSPTNAIVVSVTTDRIVKNVCTMYTLFIRKLHNQQKKRIF